MNEDSPPRAPAVISSLYVITFVFGRPEMKPVNKGGISSLISLQSCCGRTNLLQYSDPAILSNISSSTWAAESFLPYLAESWRPGLTPPSPPNEDDVSFKNSGPVVRFNSQESHRHSAFYRLTHAQVL